MLVWYHNRFCCPKIIIQKISNPMFIIIMILGIFNRINITPNSKSMSIFDYFPGAQGIVIVYLTCVVLYVLLPGRVVDGYCCESTDGSIWRRSTYKLNGFSTIVVVTAIFLQLPSSSRILLYGNIWECFFCANIIGLFISLCFFVVGGDEKYARCVTFDQLNKLQSLSKSSELPRRTKWQDFYLGRRWNPRLFYGLCDIKMLFYCIGAVALWLNVLSAAHVHQLAREGSVSVAMCTYLMCFGWFIFEYMLGEEGNT